MSNAVLLVAGICCFDSGDALILYFGDDMSDKDHSCREDVSLCDKILKYQTLPVSCHLRSYNGSILNLCSMFHCTIYNLSFG